ncbi:hypothetical protein AOCH_007306 [Aspergillus ochraceoroseus]|uniref:Uncharacterized protein n=2 Tax=Aspergillus ochraceoroseus TaxID=138278 RepID=A0A0F8U256_9EURO|nr:hypothetical protein AOCH_007306 [Aspergillus ochraceoroseus]
MLPFLPSLRLHPVVAWSPSQELHFSPGLFQTETLVRRSSYPPTPPVDEPLLAIQIGGIVGSYVIFVAIILTLLLFIGRRLRRTVQSSNYTLEVEMMKPKGAASIDPSPVTPTSYNLPSPAKSHGFRSWSSLTKGHHQSRSSNNGSVATIDEGVVASDRRRAQEEMEMLYAAVMAHDEQRAAASATGSPVLDDKETPRSPLSIQSSHTNPFSDQAAVRFPEPSSQPPAVAAPLSPRSNSRLSRISNLSLFHSSSSRPQPTPGKLRSPRLPLRKLPISSPMASPDARAPNSYGEDQLPLSPRLYNPPAPPVPPIRITTGSPERMPRNPAPPPLNLSPATQSSASLPFREAYPQLLSAPPTKTTILERPEKHLNGPRTGLPTPYSPYMPFTPLTPLTPSRIVTRKQRKREGKENGLRALDEEDVVRGDGDMWGY